MSKSFERSSYIKWDVYNYFLQNIAIINLNAVLINYLKMKDKKTIIYTNLGKCNLWSKPID